MSPNSTPERRDRREELLAAQVTEGLPVEERAELVALLAETELVEEEEWQLAAAAALLADHSLHQEVARIRDDGSIPAGVLDRIAADAPAHLPAPVDAVERGTPTLDVIEGKTPAPPRVERDDSRSPWSMFGWVAAAAALVFALATWFGGRADDPRALHAGLVERAETVLSWTATDDTAATGASGDVVWSAADQKGVMRIAGLAANDPTESQYQLWIFDAVRDERYPVDGGVFDIPADGGEVFVTIDAKLPVDAPTLFAITVEEPGGVVVSDRERIVLVASIDG